MRYKAGVSECEGVSSFRFSAAIAFKTSSYLVSCVVASSLSALQRRGFYGIAATNVSGKHLQSPSGFYGDTPSLRDPPEAETKVFT